MKSDFLVALTQLAAERNLPREMVLTAIEAALASAYRKDSVAAGQDISVKLDPGSGEVTVNILKTVVEELSCGTEILKRIAEYTEQMPSCVNMIKATLRFRGNGEMPSPKLQKKRLNSNPTDSTSSAKNDSPSAAI